MNKFTMCFTKAIVREVQAGYNEGGLMKATRTLGCEFPSDAWPGNPSIEWLALKLVAVPEDQLKGQGIIEIVCSEEEIP